MIDTLVEECDLTNNLLRVLEKTPYDLCYLFGEIGRAHV